MTRTDPSLYRARDFETFWRAYERVHARPATRYAHAVGTATAGLLIGTAVVTRRPALALLAPVVDYAIAQASHRRDGELTQPWRKPSWHLRAELRLFARTLRTVGAALRSAKRGGEDRPRRRRANPTIPSEPKREARR